MRHLLRLLPLALLAVLALGLVAPVVGQDAAEGGLIEGEGGLLTYAATSCDYGGELKSIEAVDEFTVRFTLCYPDPAFPQITAMAPYHIWPSEYIMEEAETGDLVTQPVGTGPYRLDNWALGSEVVLTAFEDYWGDQPQEPTAIFRWNPEAAARLVELQAGTVDGIDNVAPGDFAVAQADDSISLIPRDPLNVFYLGLNNTIEPFDNVKVRQAVAHAIDRQRIVDNFYPEGSVAATQFVPPAMFGHTPEVEALGYDPELARQLLEEAAAEDGFELPIETTLSYRDVVRGYLPQPGIVAQDLQAQLAEVGINVTIDQQESGTFLDNSAAGNLSLHLLGWSADYPDPTNFLDFHFGAGASPQFGEKFEEITGPLAEAAQLGDPEARLPLYVEANTAIRDLVPMVPIAHGGSATAWRAALEGAHSSPLSNEQLAVVLDPDDDNVIFMQNAEPIGLYCADETDGESFRVCEQIMEGLLGFEVGGTGTVPILAESYDVNEDATEYVFHLRPGVLFHNGTTLDANDVVISWGAMWDAASPFHVGRAGNFEYFAAFMEDFLNAPAAE